MVKSEKVLVYLVALINLLLISSVSAELIDDFDGPQKGSWAPARWWYGRDCATRGKFIVNDKEGPKLDIAFSRGRRAKEIVAAGGLVVEVEVVQVRGSAAICIGSKEFEENGIAVVVQAEQSKDKDKIYINGEATAIGTEYRPGRKVRIELNTRDLEKGSPASVSVYFDDVEVAEQTFQLQESPQAFYLAARGGQAIFDNLVLRTARPQFEFAQPSSSADEQTSQVLVDVLLKNALTQRSYSVGYSVSSRTAQHGRDYVLDGGTLTFAPGEVKKTIVLKVNSDSAAEADEVVELMLKDPTGGAELGGQVSYRHTIIGEFPLVNFEDPSLVVAENASDVHVNVVLSHACERRVLVGYELLDGSAKAGQDLRVPAGQLVFEPGQRSKSVTIDVVDDSDSENSINETAFVQLSAANNCALGDNGKLKVEIIDNEPWIEFDGSMWICGEGKHKKIKGKNILSINDKGHLEWVSTYGDILYAKLPAKSVGKVGEVAEYGWLYKGQGNATGSYVENICERYGSGDLRLAMLDLGDKSMSLEKQYTRNDKIFCGSKGYQARLSPHVPTDERADKWAIRVNPDGDNCHSPVDWGGCWGFATYYNGHGVPVGEFTPMIITLARTAEDTVEFSVTMNNEKHTMVDKDKFPISHNKKKMESLYGEGSFKVVVVEDYQPKKTDVMAIYFANQRPYDLITFAPLK